MIIRFDLSIPFWGGIEGAPVHHKGSVRRQFVSPVAISEEVGDALILAARIGFANVPSDGFRRNLLGSVDWKHFVACSPRFQNLRINQSLHS